MTSPFVGHVKRCSSEDRFLIRQLDGNGPLVLQSDELTQILFLKTI